jgi:hypothetical protein
VCAVRPREYLAEETTLDFADTRLSRREVLRRLGLLGLSTTAASALLTACSSDDGAGAESRTGPAPPADIVHGQGAWRMIGWGGNSGFPAMPEVNAKLWASRGFGGYKTAVSFLNDFGGGQNRFRGSSARNEKNPAFAQQKRIEESFHPNAAGCEGYVGCKYRDSTRPDTSSVFDWWSDSDRALFATRMGELAAFCAFSGLEGLSADTEQGFWGLNYSGNTHSDEENIARIESWGYQTGQAVFTAMPNCIMLVYNWIPPGGFAFEEVYRPDPIVDQRRYHADDSSHPTTLWYQSEAFGPKHLWWLGYAKAMADFGGASARLVNLNAFYYKPLHQAGAVQSAAYKYETQGCIAQFSQATWTDGDTFSIAGLGDEQWNKVCDRIDFSFFSWAGDDILDRAGYTHTREPDYTNQLLAMRRFGMGTRRGEYNYEGSPDNYTMIDATTRDDSHKPANNWYVADPSNPPGGHLPGMLAAASRKPVDTTPPKITVSSPRKHRDGTFTVTGAAFHPDGIRCVRGYVHPHRAARVAARLTWNKQAGTAQTNLNSATQDYTLTVTARPGQYLMLTAVSIHDQEHSIRVRL